MPGRSTFEVPKGVFHGSWCLPIYVMTDIADGDIVTSLVPGFPGRIVKWCWVQGTVVSTGSKLSTLNLEINAVNVHDGSGTNSTISLTSAACATLGAVIAGTAIGGANNFDSDDTISVEASSTSAFIEGAGTIVIEYEGKVL